MIQKINASGYPFAEDDYKNEFEYILSKIITCYNLMITDHVLLKNDENAIRDVLYLEYLNNNKNRRSIGLLNYYFDRETQEDKTAGRTDIRILTANSFLETEAYYIIECKRIDAKKTSGKSGLNAKYIKDGMYRFTSVTYSTHYKTNGMIGFIVEPMDIDKNKEDINNLLGSHFSTLINTQQDLQFRKIKKSFRYSYCSRHTSKKNKLLLYHLMLDFSKNIQ